MEETACRNKALQQKYRFSGLACRETHTEQAKRMFWTSSEFFRASAFLFPTGSRFSVALAFFLPTESCFSMALAVLLPAGFRRNCPPGIYRKHNGLMAPAHCTEAGKVFADKKSLEKTTFRGGQFAKVTFWGGTFEQVRERKERLAWLHKQFDHLNFIWPYEDDQGVWLDTSRDWQWNSYGCTSLAPGPSQDKVRLAVESCANQSSQC